MIGGLPGARRIASSTPAGESNEKEEKILRS